MNREAPPNPPTDEEVGEGELDIDTEPPTEKDGVNSQEWEGTRNRPNNSRTIEG